MDLHSEFELSNSRSTWGFLQSAWELEHMAKKISDSNDCFLGADFDLGCEGSKNRKTWPLKRASHFL